MITEDYVSFETAKLLKEKGFDEICYLGYNKNGEYVPTGNRTNSEIIQPDFCFICCPTLQMAMKWLREVYNKHCDISFDIELGWYFQIIDLKQIVEDFDYPGMKIYHSDNDCGFQSHEDTADAAIKYCLKNLI